jgi:hypothetical protein
MLPKSPINTVPLPGGTWEMIDQKGRTLRGLHDIIRQQFYPFYSYEAATNGPRTGPYSEPACRVYQITQVRNKYRPGQMAGIKLDLAIKNCIESGKAPTVDHPPSCAFFKSVAEHHMRAADAQVAVGDSSMFMGTKVDVVCTPKAKPGDTSAPEAGVYLLEVKSGFDYYLYRHTVNNMQPPLSAFSDSPFNQHNLQLLLTKHMYRKTFPGVKVLGCFLVYVSYTSVCWVSLNTEMEELLDQIVSTLRPIQQARPDNQKKTKVCKSFAQKMAILHSMEKEKIKKGEPRPMKKKKARQAQAEKDKIVKRVLATK